MANLNVNGKVLPATRGETIIDVAMAGGVLIPQDCGSGHCETCRVRLVAGSVDDKGTAYGDTVLACRATVTDDCSIAFEDVPPVTTVRGEVTNIISVTPDILEVTIALAETLTYKPGQYVSAAFAGFPAREYSPTVRLDGTIRPFELVLHIKRLAKGVVSSQIGRRIGLGHAVRVRGPLGSAFLRDSVKGTLLLTSTGAGWAPIWSIAHAACRARERPQIRIIAGARDPDSLYMRPALRWLRDMGIDDIVTTVRNAASGDALPGTPDDYLSSLSSDDVVHVAGAPILVDAVKARALARAARCYADPFTPSGNTLGLTARVAGILSLFRSPKSRTELRRWVSAPISDGDRPHL